MLDVMDMNSNNPNYYNTLSDYRAAETELHTELMAVTRKYISKLGIVSLMGILDIVKQETIELERVTKQNFNNTNENQPTDNVPPQQNNYQQASSDYFR